MRVTNVLNTKKAVKRKAKVLEGRMKAYKSNGNLIDREKANDQQNLRLHHKPRINWKFFCQQPRHGRRKQNDGKHILDEQF